MTIAGIDGCRSGWIVATSDVDLSEIVYCIVSTEKIGEVFRTIAGEGGTVAIDIPVGLHKRDPRACDLAARQYLGSPRGSSVFPAPCRGTLPATTYRRACELNSNASGKKISCQTYCILPKIRAVDDAITPELQEHVRESHPEVVFAKLSGKERGLSSKKKSTEGRLCRRELLENQLGSYIDVDAIRDKCGRSNLPVDDLLDALACLVAARDIATQNATVLPDDKKEWDQRGLRMEIVA